MGWWKADAVQDVPQPPVNSAVLPRPKPAQDTKDPNSACPVDPKSREIWLQQAKSKQSDLPPSHPPLPASSQITSVLAGKSSEECSSDRIDQSIKPLSPSQTSPHLPRPLSHERVISSIPRGATSSSMTTPANSQNSAPVHSSGNWIYPSESQFFEAVVRKQSASPEAIASSVSSIIPIHNAVNERAWKMIKAWEGNSSAACGGPKLLSFKGLGAGALSPQAKLNSLMGYNVPFDRHDWVVERCGGKTVEYIIDFYQGKDDSSGRSGQLSFYLDVRPKLNSLEGWKMRAERIVGMR